MAWYKFPKGTTEISVEKQNFKIEHTDPEGFGYFQAPEHFGPRILEFSGFQQVPKPEGAEIEDLPQGDPVRDGVISDLMHQHEVLREENRDLRTTLNATSADLNAIRGQRDELQTRVADLVEENGALRERLEDYEDASKTQDEVDKKKKAKAA